MTAKGERRKVIWAGVVVGIMGVVVMQLSNEGRTLASNVGLFLVLVGFVFELRSIMRWKEATKAEGPRFSSN